MDEIVLKLKYLEYPFTLKDMKLFNESINSPTQIRYNAIEWLFSLMEKDNIESLFGQENKYSQEEKIVLLFQFFNLDETKDNILGYSTAINNNKTFLNLLNFTIKYLNIKNKKNILNQELDLATKLIDVIDNNKNELFKNDIRLFINDKNKINKKNNKINIQKINDDINNCKLLIEKVDKKLEKLNKIDIIGEKKEEKNIYDKLELKKYLNTFEKNLDETNTELLNQYKKIEDVSSILEEMFSIHNKIIK